MNPLHLPPGATLLYRAEAVRHALDIMASQVTEEVGAVRPLILIVLTGGVYAGVWLTERLRFELEVDFVRISRYRSGISAGSVEWRVKPHLPAAGRTVLLVDDVWDEGVTLTTLKRWLVEAGAARVLSAVLIWKQAGSPGGLEERPDIFGLKAGREWLIGCGLDLDGRWRHLPEIYAVPEPDSDSDPRPSD